MPNATSFDDDDWSSMPMSLLPDQKCLLELYSWSDKHNFSVIMLVINQTYQFDIEIEINQWFD